MQYKNAKMTSTGVIQRIDRAQNIAGVNSESRLLFLVAKPESSSRILVSIRPDFVPRLISFTARLVPHSQPTKMAMARPPSGSIQLLAKESDSSKKLGPAVLWLFPVAGNAASRHS